MQQFVVPLRLLVKQRRLDAAADEAAAEDAAASEAAASDAATLEAAAADEAASDAAATEAAVAAAELADEAAAESKSAWLTSAEVGTSICWSTKIMLASEILLVLTKSSTVMLNLSANSDKVSPFLYSVC